MLHLRAYSDACAIYLEPGLADSRYALVPNEMSQLFAALKKFYLKDNIRGAVAFFAKWGLDTPPRGSTLTTDIFVCTCPNLRRPMGPVSGKKGRQRGVPCSWRIVRKRVLGDPRDHCAARQIRHPPRRSYALVSHDQDLREEAVQSCISAQLTDSSLNSGFYVSLSISHFGCLYGRRALHAVC